jgi:hypothetical protein
MALYDRADVAGTQAALGDIAGQDHVTVHFEGHVLPRVHGNKSRHVGASVNLPDGTKLDAAAERGDPTRARGERRTLFTPHYRGAYAASRAKTGFRIYLVGSRGGSGRSGPRPRGMEEFL